MPDIKDCDACGSIVKHIPAGTSKKTGKPYNDFWVCSNDTCSTNTRRQQSTTQAPNRSSEASSFESDVLERLATRLDSIDEKLSVDIAELKDMVRKVIEMIEVQNTFFRKEQNNKPGVAIDHTERQADVPMSSPGDEMPPQTYSDKPNTW